MEDSGNDGQEPGGGQEPAEKTDNSSGSVSIADQIEALKTELKEICKCQVRKYIQYIIQDHIYT